MAVGPRKHGKGRRPVVKRRRKSVTARVNAESPWSPAAYRARDLRRSLETAPAAAPDDPDPRPDARVFESESTDSANAGREALQPAQKPSSPILESQWTLDAYAAREAVRRFEEASPPIMESDWTLGAYRERNEAIPAAPRTTTQISTGRAAEPTAPEIRIDFAPAWLDRPQPGGKGPPSRRFAYAAGALAIVATGAFLLRPEAPVATPPMAADGLNAKASPPQTPAPPAATTPTPPPVSTVPASTQSVEPSHALPLEKGASPNPPATTGASAPGALPAPSGVSATPPPPGAGAQPTPASAIPARPADNRAAAPPRKPRAADSHQKGRERGREERGPSNWFDQMVNSVKRLGRVLTP